jgi:hypothetical protein
MRKINKKQFLNRAQLDARHRYCKKFNFSNMHLWKKKLIVSIKGYVCAHEEEEEGEREMKTTNECAGQ